MKMRKEICRLCLHSIPRGRRIAIADEEFQQKLKIVFPFSILTAENLPIDACRGCLVTVENFYAYSEQVRLNQTNLMGTPIERDTDDGEQAEAIKQETLEENFSECANTNSPPNGSEGSKEKNFHIEVIKVEPIMPESLQDASTDQEEPSVEHLLDSMMQTETTDSVSNDIPREEEDETEQKKTESSKTKLLTRKASVKRTTLKKITHPLSPPPTRPPKKKKLARAEDEELLRKHFHFGCEMCSFMGDTVPNLFQHYREQHQTPGFIQCCNRKFFRRARLLEHLGGHLGSIVCDICGKVYKNTFHLELHKIDHEAKPDARQFKCEQCNRSFHKQYHLKVHQKRHERVQCTVCHKVLAGEQGLKLHMQKMHGKDTTQICPTCGKEFRCMVAMARHLKAHLGLVTVERVQCDQCAKWFDGKLNLRNHIKAIHEESGQLQCDECQHVSPNRRALAHHKMRVHRRRTVHECEHCGKKLYTKLNLREHLATHTNVPLYSCEFCGVTFNSNANKYSHRKSKHPKEWEALRQQKLMRTMGPATAAT